MKKKFEKAQINKINLYYCKQCGLQKVGDGVYYIDPNKSMCNPCIWIKRKLKKDEVFIGLTTF